MKDSTCSGRGKAFLRFLGPAEGAQQARQGQMGVGQIVLDVEPPEDLEALLDDAVGAP